MNVVLAGNYLSRSTCTVLYPTFVVTSPLMSFGGLLIGKVVCITGASRGIGRATALEACQHGASGLLLHFFGDAETTEEMQSLTDELKELNENCKVVSVPGDIAVPRTSLQVEARCTTEICILTCS